MSDPQPSPSSATPAPAAQPAKQPCPGTVRLKWLAAAPYRVWLAGALSLGLIASAAIAVLVSRAWASPAEPLSGAQIEVSSVSSLVVGQEPTVDLSTHVPADALAFCQVTPDATSQDGATELLAMLSPLGSFVPGELKAWLDLLSPLPVLARAEHAWALLDVGAEIAADGDPKLGKLDLALIVHVGDDPTAVLERLQAMVASFSAQADSTLEMAERRAGFPSQVLVNRRLPPWAVVEWGPLGSSYAICLGTGVFDRLVAVYERRAANLASDPWFRRSGLRTGGPHGYVTAYGDLAAIRGHLEPMLGDRPLSVAAGLDLADVKKTRWTLSQNGPALRSIILFERAYRDELIVLANGNPSDPLAKLLPRQARWFSISRFDLPDVLQRAGRGYLASRSPEEAQSDLAWWHSVSERAGGDPYELLGVHLGPTLAMHNFPAHPLQWRFAVTLLIEHDNAATIRPTLDVLLGTWREHLNSRLARRRLFTLRLVRDSDGIWSLPLLPPYLSPSVGVSDRFMIISYSPKAVRENLADLAGKPQ